MKDNKVERIAVKNIIVLISLFYMFIFTSCSAEESNTQENKIQFAQKLINKTHGNWKLTQFINEKPYVLKDDSEIYIMYLKGKFNKNKTFEILIQYHYVKKIPTFGGYYFKSQKYTFADGFIIFPDGNSRHFSNYTETKF
jgi:hypothetical protein